MSRSILQLWTLGPETFDDACKVRNAYLQMCQRATIAPTEEEIRYWLEQAERWSKWLNACRILHAQETERVKPVAILHMTAMEYIGLPEPKPELK